MSNIIQRLKQENALAFYSDYRAGHFWDLSGNNNHGTPTDVFLTGNGCAFPKSSSLITVADSPELRTIEGCLVAFGLHYSTSTTQVLISKRDVGGTMWQFGIRTNSVDGLFLFDGLNTRTITTDTNSKKYLAINFKNGEVPDAYIEGQLIAPLNDVVSISDNDADITIGNLYSGTRQRNRGFYGCALITNRKLTADEHSELYCYLSNLQWPKAPYIFSMANIEVNCREDEGIVAGWDMFPADNKIIDKSANGNDGTITKAVQEWTPLGTALNFNGVDNYVNCGNDSSLDLTTDITLSAWFKASDLSHAGGSNNPRIICKNGSYQIFVSSAGVLAAQFFGLSDTAINPTTIIQLDQWYYVVATYSQVTGNKKIYINGILENIEGSITGTITVTTNPVVIGNINQLGTARFWEGLILNPMVHSVAKDQTWVTKQYEQGRQALFHTDFGVYESVSNWANGGIENTPFIVDSGSFKVSIDTIEGQLCKVFECVTSGNLKFPVLFDNADDNWVGWLDTGSGYSSQTLSLSSSLLALTAGDKLGYSDVNGNHSIIKRLLS